MNVMIRILVLTLILFSASLSLISCDTKSNPVNLPPDQIAPGIPEDPSPGVNVEGTMLSVRLSWFSRDRDDDTLEYDIYFGDAPDPPLLRASFSNNALVVSNLDFESRYYWKILARDKYDMETMGPVWTFTTISNVEVDFDEPQIELQVRTIIGKSSGALHVSDVMDINSLSVYNSKLRSLAGLEYMIGLRTLELNSYYGFREGGSIGYDENRNIFQSLAPLQSLRRLVILDLDNSYVSDLKYLSQMDSLRVLRLSGAAINNLTAIERLPSLGELRLRRASGIHLTEIDRIGSLETLDLQSSNLGELRGLEGFADQGKLKTLYLGSNSISDLNSLRQISSLKNLYLEGNEISEIRPLTYLSNLSALNISDNAIQDQQYLDQLANLEFLDISGTGITRLEFLEDMTNMENLRCDDLVATDLSVLENMPHLITLFWRNSDITDINALANSTALEELDLGHNSIRDISVLEGLIELRWIYLNSNSIGDILPLVNNSGMGRNDLLWLADNPLNEITINTYIPELRERGVTIDY